MRLAVRSAIMAIAAILSLLMQVEAIAAAEKSFGPFIVDDAKPDVITLKGPIDVGAALNFRRALAAAPEAKIISLNSVGGTVQMALLIADDIHQRSLATYIAKDSGCYSACAYLFLAGKERQVDGELGVHQISSDSSNLVDAQLTISDIIEVLNRFDTPIDVMSVMFRTPPREMHIFTPEEIERYKLNRKNGGIYQPIQPNTSTSANGDQQSADVTQEDSAVSPTLPADDKTKVAQPAAKSAIEEFVKRPNRLAVYAGLDLFGNDLSATRVSNASECAMSCLNMNGTCKAFTFNTNPKIVKGPNCFLKSNTGRTDGNSIAFSGWFLSAAEADPSPFTIAIIDPQNALFRDVDLPGGDLSRKPFGAARTPLSCRLACIDDNRCVAFTYIYAKKECWLKGAMTTPIFRKGLVSGLKKIQSFAPAKIIGLD